MNHSFIVLAYKNSEYIEDLFDSLFAQTEHSEIQVATSTPTDALRQKAERYGLKVRVNPVAGGIASDWNFAYETARTDCVTLAHQDDLYEPDFTKRTMAAFRAAKDPILVYTNYFEIRPEGRTYANRLLRIKRLMNLPVGAFPKSPWVRNHVFAFGCPVSCPSVTYNKKRFPDFRFSGDYKNDLDWEAWHRLAAEPGEFIYLPTPLIGHRIHDESETTNSILSGVRSREDLEMFRKYWKNEKWIRFLHRLYEGGMKSNDIEEP
ncbi:MAG: glycosyltransferase family 2 protein [Clostridiales Family XIII bacterium]|jgi:glycosyltransferase involved in cell wall biosynthesis|nr:glycosyltransferase family 2 protein [Clostridiales Family XIII bacterium]